VGKYVPFTFAATARRMKELGFDNPRNPWVCIRDFLDDWYAANWETRGKMLDEEPPETGDRRFDAYLGSPCGALCGDLRPSRSRLGGQAGKVPGSVLVSDRVQEPPWPWRRARRPSGSGASLSIRPPSCVPPRAQFLLEEIYGKQQLQKKRTLQQKNNTKPKRRPRL